MGDPAGIGPEICAKTLALKEIYDMCRPIVVGDAGVMANAVRFCGLKLEVAGRRAVSEARFALGGVDVFDLKNLPLDQLRHKEVTAAQGRASFEYVAKVIELAMAGEIDATVTGPINKAAINAAGVPLRRTHGDLRRSHQDPELLHDAGGGQLPRRPRFDPRLLAGGLRAR